MALPGLATVVGLAGAAVGVWLTGAHQRIRVVVPFSAGVLLGVALFGLVPELAIGSGWTTTLLLFAGGYLMLFAVNRFAYPVCPTCAHDHDHNACVTELHGFALPLAAAAMLHSFLDGWSVTTTEVAALGLRVAVPLAILMHKIPEGIALGGILRASVKTRPRALGWCAIAEGTTLLGGIAGLWMSPHLGSRWTAYPIGLTAGWLFYLGYHAVHEETKRRGLGPALASAVCGMGGAALIQRGAEALLR
jgi:zinc transporter ZupT